MKKIIVVFLFASALFGQRLEQIKYFQSNSISVNSNKILDATETTFNKKSAGLAIIYSLLLPGMGEYYAESYSTGKYFTIADLAFWGSLAGFNYYGKWQENNYKSFAKAKAGVNPDGKEAKYFADIANYLNISEYNKSQELNRDFAESYDEATHSWKWANEVQRKEYRNMWISSEQAYNNIRFAVGALILNRIASAIIAVRAVSNYNKKLNQDVGYNFNFETQNINPYDLGIQFNLNKSF